MSRKIIQKNENTLGGRLYLFRESEGYNIPQFADILDISPGNLSDIENNNSKPSAKPINNLILETDINIHWLFTGEGERTRSEAKKGENSLSILYKEGGDEEDLEVADLLVMTREVVKSKTEYAESLKANIRSFHHSVVIEERLSRLEKQVSKLSEPRPAAEPAPSMAAQLTVREEAAEPELPDGAVKKTS